MRGRLEIVRVPALMMGIGFGVFFWSAFLGTGYVESWGSDFYGCGVL